MFTLQCLIDEKPATLHVFVQDGAWRWAIRVLRERGCVLQVIAYSENGFASESDAMSLGSLALDRIADMSVPKSADATGTVFPAVMDDRRRYMRERMHRTMTSLAGCNEANKGQATRWVIAWRALIGEQHFDKALWKRHRDSSPVD